MEFIFLISILIFCLSLIFVTLLLIVCIIPKYRIKYLNKLKINIIVVFIFGGISIFGLKLDQKEKSESLGFSSVIEYESAKDHNIDNPEDWKAYKNRIAKQKEMDALKELAACRQDFQCWGEKARINKEGACKRAIENMARFDTRWTDDGWLEYKFEHFKWKNKSKGIITLMGDKLQLQNGFGAWRKVRYECDVDPMEHNGVIDVRIF